MTDVAALLCQAWLNKANDLMRISKSYKCRSTEAIKIAYIKQAAQLRMCADDLENAYAQQARKAPAQDHHDQPIQGNGTGTDGTVAEERPVPQAYDRQSAPVPEPQDQAP